MSRTRVCDFDALLDKRSERGQDGIRAKALMVSSADFALVVHDFIKEQCARKGSIHPCTSAVRLSSRRRLVATKLFRARPLRLGYTLGALISIQQNMSHHEEIVTEIQRLLHQLPRHAFLDTRASLHAELAREQGKTWWCLNRLCGGAVAAGAESAAVLSQPLLSCIFAYMDLADHAALARCSRECARVSRLASSWSWVHLVLPRLFGGSRRLAPAARSYEPGVVHDSQCDWSLVDRILRHARRLHTRERHLELSALEALLAAERWNWQTPAGQTSIGALFVPGAGHWVADLCGRSIRTLLSDALLPPRHCAIPSGLGVWPEFLVLHTFARTRAPMRRMQRESLWTGGPCFWQQGVALALDHDIEAAAFDVLYELEQPRNHGAPVSALDKGALQRRSGSNRYPPWQHHGGHLFQQIHSVKAGFIPTIIRMVKSGSLVLLQHDRQHDCDASDFVVDAFFTMGSIGDVKSRLTYAEHCCLHPRCAAARPDEVVKWMRELSIASQDSVVRVKAVCFHMRLREQHCSA